MVKRLHFLSLLFCTLFIGVSAYAGNGHSFGQPSPSLPSAIRFSPNLGQWEPQVLLAADIGHGGRVFLEQGQLRFAFCNTENLHEDYFHGEKPRSELMLDCHAYSIVFDGANPAATILPQEKGNDYLNFFVGNDSTHWASEVPLYGSVVYQNIYPGIDYVLHGGETTLKYDFIVHQGADPSVIKMHFLGQDGLKLDGKGLAIITSLITVQDSTPVALQQGQQIPCVFTRMGDVIGFSMPYGYDHQQTLVIDPTMVFSTFTGSQANNFGFTATYDDDGNLYAGGIAFGTGYPVTNGAYQVNFAGGSFDVSISKFSTSGAHLYSTYIGGNNEDQPHSMVVDPSGNLFVMGRTFSSNFPVSSSAYDGNSNGGSDIFVSKLSASGATLMGSTYIGGSADDALNITTNYSQSGLKHNYGDDARGEIVVDDLGNAYVANCTKSNNFPTTGGAFRNNNSGMQDGCVFKLNPNLSTMVWSTYLGGGLDDAAYALKVDANSNVVVAGGTASSNFPATSGSYDPTYNGGIDGFIARINSSGTAILSSTFVGNTSYNQCYFVELDDNDDIYVVGQKEGSWPITSGVWSTSQGGQFIMKFNPNLSGIIYSTQFGTSNSNINISPTAFLVDVCEYVYVAGWGGSTNFNGNTNGLPTTGDAFQGSTDGSDLYILVLTNNATSIDYGTFIGGPQSNEHVDGGTSRFNKDAEIYHSVCAGCWGNSDFPTSSGAYSNVNNSSCNLACFKMKLDLPGIRSAFQPSPGVNGCAPMAVSFTNQSQGGITFTWNFADPGSGALNTSTLNSPTHVFNAPGNYTVMLVAHDPNSCNITDTTYTTITVSPSPVAQVSPNTSVCAGQSIVLNASGGQTYTWSPGTGLSGIHSASPTVSPTNTTTYQVVVAGAGGCRDTAQVTVTVLPAPNAVATGDATICRGDSVQIIATGGGTYSWSPGTPLNNPNAANPWAQPNTTTPFIVTVTGANGCTDRDTVLVQVSNVTAQAGPDINLCIGSDTVLNASGGGTYLWSPPAFISNTSVPNPTVNPPVSTTYQLQVTDVFGCTDTDIINVVIQPLPLVWAGPDQILCEQDSLPLNAAGALNYIWSPASFLSNPNIGNPFAFPSSTISYSVIGTDQYGCRNQDSITIIVLPAPTAQALGPVVLCEDSVAQLQGLGGNSYEWFPSNVYDNPNISTPRATLDTTTALILRVVGSNGCDDFDTLRIAVTPTPQIDAGGARLVCLNNRVTLMAFGSNSVLWSTGDTSRRIFVYPTEDTTYYVTGFVDGCPSEPEAVPLTVDTNLPEASFVVWPDSGILPLTTNFQNNSQGGATYTWIFGDGTESNSFETSHVYGDTGRYFPKLIVYNSNGCTDTAVAKVIVGLDFTIYVPNAFTPNDDMVNDYFNTPWVGVREFHIMIFDRWGMLIYESFDPDFKWYGIFKGDPCQEGVYTYVLEASGFLGKKVKRAGTVTLYR